MFAGFNFILYLCKVLLEMNTIRITSSYFKKPDIERGNRKLRWMTKDGNKLFIHQMQTSHIQHILKCFYGKSKNYQFSSSKLYYGARGKVWIVELSKELKYRRLMGDTWN